MAPAAERSLFPALHQRYVAAAAGSADALGTHGRCRPTASEPGPQQPARHPLRRFVGKSACENSVDCLQGNTGEQDRGRVWQSLVPVLEVLSLVPCKGRSLSPLLAAAFSSAVPCSVCINIRGIQGCHLA